MKTKQLFTIAIASIGSLAISACDVEKTQEGELPDVDVEVEGGKLPKYDVDAGDIDVGTKKVEVEVPTIDVDTPAEDEAEDGED